MSWTSEASGTQAATIGTEHTLHTNAGNKTFVLLVDTANMVNGDILELRVKTKVLTGGTAVLAYGGTYRDVQDSPIKISIPVPSDFSVTFTLKQTAGTGRNYDWKVLSQ